MSSPSTRVRKQRRRLTTPVTPTDDSGFQPTPPPRRPTSSSSSRPVSGASSTHGSVSSRSSITEIPHVSRQNSVLAPLGNDINYDMLPDANKSPITIGRYHTIVPPITRPETAGRPISSRSNSIMAETPLPQNLNLSDEYSNDDHAITSISEENDPTGTPRLLNPLVYPRYIETPSTDLSNSDTQQQDLTNNNIETLPTLPDEPTDGEPRVRIAVKLLNGSRIDRYFRPSDQMQIVLNFASMHTGNVLKGYTLRSADSKYNNMMSTLDDCKIGDKTLLQLTYIDL